MATATKASKVFAGLRCPACGEAESLFIQVEGLTLMCTSCEEAIDRAEVEAMIATWRRLFSWLDSASEFAAPK